MPGGISHICTKSEDPDLLANLFLIQNSSFFTFSWIFTKIIKNSHWQLKNSRWQLKKLRGRTQKLVTEKLKFCDKKSSQICVIFCVHFVFNFVYEICAWLLNSRDRLMMSILCARFAQLFLLCFLRVKKGQAPIFFFIFRDDRISKTSGDFGSHDWL